MRTKPAPRERDAAVAAFATSQHGVVTTAQLAAAGLDSAAIARRMGAGRLHRVHLGVYAVGHAALSNEGRWMAAVLGCGAGAVLSHRSAAVLWALLKAGRGPVHVSVPGRVGRTRRPGIVVHRPVALVASQTTLRRSVPVTSVARTLSDLRRAGTPEEHRRALREAEWLGLALGDEGSDGTASELEDAMLGLCRRHRLPRPEVNEWVCGFKVDFVWREPRLVVETDGWEGHRGRVAFEEDRARDLKLKLAGFEVVRFTYRQVTRQPQRVAAALGALLERRGVFRSHAE